MTSRHVGHASQMRHRPGRPIDELEGTWLVERAVAGDRIWIDGRRGRVWELTVRHRATGQVEHLRARALVRTLFRDGQEVDGHVYRDREGLWFQRAAGQTGGA